MKSSRQLLGERIVDLELEVRVRHGSRRQRTLRIEAGALVDRCDLSPCLAEEQRNDRCWLCPLGRRRCARGSALLPGLTRDHRGSQPGSHHHAHQKQQLSLHRILPFNLRTSRRAPRAATPGSEVHCRTELHESRRHYEIGPQPRSVRNERLVVGQDGARVQHLYKSTPTFVRVRPTRTTFATRRFTSLMRSPHTSPGSTRLTVTFAAFPDRGRPSDGMTAEFGTA